MVAATGPAPDARTRVAVLGASGYSGGELVRLLLDHPWFEIAFLGARDSAGQTLGASHPHLAGSPLGGEVLRAMEPEAIAEAADLVFSALPNGASSTLAPALLDGGAAVIDLAGDFRLSAAAYPVWYGFEHPAPAWLDEAVYGLPELFGDRVGGAKLVANPGCYPTPTILGLAPLLAAGLVEPGAVRVDGKTGLSGAGRAAVEAMSFAATEDSVRPYRVPAHQHTPEMERGIALATGIDVPVLFVPHLVPTVRGVVTTSYAPLAAGTTTDALVACLAAAYGGQPFVRVLGPGEMADSKRTRGTNLVELQAVADPRTGTAVVVGAVDNLVKGAAGQAIQNANLVLGLPQETGLGATAVYP
jgi:N-acetyl-gamma-glutamyl-phosphate reductase